MPCTYCLKLSLLYSWAKSIYEYEKGKLKGNIKEISTSLSLAILAHEIDQQGCQHIYAYNPPLIFARFYWLFYVTWCKLQDGYHAITPVCVDICPPIISVKKKQSQRKKGSSGVSTFHLYYLHRRKTNSFC